MLAVLTAPERIFADCRRLSLTVLLFHRLSDEVDQEYLSQDEVESSLQRSQRILVVSSYHFVDILIE